MTRIYCTYLLHRKRKDFERSMQGRVHVCKYTCTCTVHVYFCLGGGGGGDGAGVKYGEKGAISLPVFQFLLYMWTIYTSLVDTVCAECTAILINTYCTMESNTKCILFIPRVLQCLSPRQNWDSPPPSPASECPPPQKKKPKGGGTHSPACEGVGDSQFA